MSTLRFGNRAKSIKNVARVNQQRSVEELTKLLMRAEKAIDVQGKYIAQLEAKMKNSSGERTQLPPPRSEATETGQGGGDEPQGAATTRQRRGSFTAENLALETKLMT